MKQLLNLPPPTYHHSTSVVTVPEVRNVEIASLIAGTELNDSSFTSQFLEEVNTPDVKHMIAKAIKLGVPSSPVDSTTHMRVALIHLIMMICKKKHQNLLNYSTLIGFTV